MIKQNKGKDLHKVPKSKIPRGPFYVSKKKDGHYVQIKKKGSAVQMWTSGGKPFRLTALADYILSTFIKCNFHIECEFNYGCSGRLGDRGKSAILTTYRTNYAKNIPTYGSVDKSIFTVLDILDMQSIEFEHRVERIRDLFNTGVWFISPHFKKVETLDEAIKLSTKWKSEGWEGGMVKTTSHIYQPGKRSNDIIKIKPRKTADLKCIDVAEGEGKYAGMIGSLLLEDSRGVQVWAGSGLSDEQRGWARYCFINKVWEIEYEQLQDTYIQPIIKHLRLDKSINEID